MLKAWGRETVFQGKLNEISSGCGASERKRDVGRVERGLVDLKMSWDVGRVRKRNWWLGVRIVDMSGKVTVVFWGRGWSTVPWNHRVDFVVWVVFFVVEYVGWLLLDW